MGKLKAYRNEETGRWFLDGVEDEKLTYARMLDSLKNNTAFKFARYGDGEIYCMNGKSGANCDGHVYFPDLGNSLRQAIQDQPRYMVGIQPLSVSHLPEDVENYFGKFKNLYNADVLHNASIDGEIIKFINAISGRYIILVGPPHLASLFNNCVHIVLPSVNCWTEYQAIKQQIEFHLDGVNNAVVLLAASMMSEVIIDHFEDALHTFIDVGSVFDPYCGVKSRKYHHKLKV
jgi:hypothetical protein